MDWDARNAVGVKPAAELDRTHQAVQDLDGLTALLCDPALDIEHFIGFFGASLGINDPETYLYQISSMGLFPNDSAEYKQRTEYGERTEAAYRRLRKR